MLSWYERTDGQWEVTYQRNERSKIELLCVGTKQECLNYIDDFIESWG
jgi:hypothetical protein